MDAANRNGSIEREVVVSNREGLHFRPIMQFVDLASKYNCKLTVECNERSADGRSPMELLMLVGTRGTRMKLTAEGEDAQAAVNALVKLVESGFGEA